MSQYQSLKDELESLQNQVNGNNPNAAVAFEKYIQYLRDQGVGNGLKTGDKAPDFTLEDASGKLITLSEELVKSAVILIFYRGEWCPFCNLQLKAYERIMKDIKAAGAQLIAISPQTPDHSLSTKEKNELSFFVLSDTNNETAEKYNLKFKMPDFMHANLTMLAQYNGDHSFELPIPATYVIDKDGFIIASASDINHRTRMEPSEVLELVRFLNQG
jgi:peroxiredoxin